MMKTIYISFLYLLLSACNNAATIEEKNNDSILINTNDTVQINANMPLDTIEDRELDPWEEYTMTNKDSILYNHLAGFYFVPDAAGINLKFDPTDGSCKFHNLEEKLQACVYQVQNGKLVLFSYTGVKYIFKIQPSPTPNNPTEIRLIMGDYQFVKGEEIK